MLLLSAVEDRPPYNLRGISVSKVHLNHPGKKSKNKDKHTAQAPATDATIPPEITIGLKPLVLLNTIPLKAPARIVFAASFFPRKYPIPELKQL